MLRIGLIGEFDPEVEAHVAIPQALDLASKDLGYLVEATWLATPQLEQVTMQTLAGYQALWFVPNTPYANGWSTTGSQICA